MYRNQNLLRTFSRLAAAVVFAVIFWASNVSAQEASENAAVDPTPTPAKSQALWEVGLAGGVGSFANYPASDDYRVRAIPLPYFIYRGTFLRADDEGTRLRAKFTPSVELEFSGGGALSSNSNSGGPRAGMPNLDYLLELGPSLKIIAAKPSPSSRLIFDVPVRAVISSNFYSRVDWRGVVFAPDVGIENNKILGTQWGGRVGVGAEFATARTQQYFYQVDTQYALPDRPAYNAHGGYLGSNIEVAVYRPLTPHFRIYAYGRFDLYNGARNEDSPLFKSDTGFGAILGFAWSIWQSKEMADHGNGSFTESGGGLR